MKPLIDPALVHQIFVGANLRNAPAIKHDDFVGPPDRRQSMSDDDDRAILDQIVQCALHQHLGFRVEVGGGFIQDEDGRVLQQCSRNGKTLALASAQLRSTFTDDRIVSLRQARR